MPTGGANIVTWLTSFFSDSLLSGQSGQTAGGTVESANPIWNACISLSQGFLTVDDLSFPTALKYVFDTLYPWFLSAGLVLLNLFCFLGFIRQASNLRENVTSEMWIELFIKVIIGNVLMTNGLTIMQEFLGVAQKLNQFLLKSGGTISLANSASGAGATALKFALGLIYFIVVAAAGITILVEIVTRYFSLYFLMAVSPIALSTLAGGRGFENTAISWFKSFLATVFQLCGITLILEIGTKMCDANWISIMSQQPAGNLLSGFGAMPMLINFIITISVAGAVKGSDALIKRAFDLR